MSENSEYYQLTYQDEISISELGDVNCFSDISPIRICVDNDSNENDNVEYDNNDKKEFHNKQINYLFPSPNFANESFLGLSAHLRDLQDEIDKLPIDFKSNDIDDDVDDENNIDSLSNHFENWTFSDFHSFDDDFVNQCNNNALISDEDDDDDDDDDGDNDNGGVQQAQDVAVNTDISMSDLLFSNLSSLNSIPNIISPTQTLSLCSKSKSSSSKLSLTKRLFGRRVRSSKEHKNNSIISLSLTDFQQNEEKEKSSPKQQQQEKQNNMPTKDEEEDSTEPYEDYLDNHEILSAVLIPNSLDDSHSNQHHPPTSSSPPVLQEAPIIQQNNLEVKNHGYHDSFSSNDFNYMRQLHQEEIIFVKELCYNELHSYKEYVAQLEEELSSSRGQKMDAEIQTEQFFLKNLQSTVIDSLAALQEVCAQVRVIFEYHDSKFCDQWDAGRMEIIHLLNILSTEEYDREDLISLDRILTMEEVITRVMLLFSRKNIAMMNREQRPLSCIIEELSDDNSCTTDDVKQLFSKEIQVDFSSNIMTEDATTACDIDAEDLQKLLAMNKRLLEDNQLLQNNLTMKSYRIAELELAMKKEEENVKICKIDKSTFCDYLPLIEEKIDNFPCGTDEVAQLKDYLMELEEKLEEYQSNQEQLENLLEIKNDEINELQMNINNNLLKEIQQSNFTIEKLQNQVGELIKQKDLMEMKITSFSSKQNSRQHLLDDEEMSSSSMSTTEIISVKENASSQYQVCDNVDDDFSSSSRRQQKVLMKDHYMSTQIKSLLEHIRLEGLQLMNLSTINGLTDTTTHQCCNSNSQHSHFIDDKKHKTTIPTSAENEDEPSRSSSVTLPYVDMHTMDDVVSCLSNATFVSHALNDNNTEVVHEETIITCNSALEKERYALNAATNALHELLQRIEMWHNVRPYIDPSCEPSATSLTSRTSAVAHAEDWRLSLLLAVQEAYSSDRELCSTRLESLMKSSDNISPHWLLIRDLLLQWQRQHQISSDRLYAADRQSLIKEINYLKQQLKVTDEVRRNESILLSQHFPPPPPPTATAATSAAAGTFTLTNNIGIECQLLMNDTEESLRDTITQLQHRLKQNENKIDEFRHKLENEKTILNDLRKERDDLLRDLDESKRENMENIANISHLRESINENNRIISSIQQQMASHLKENDQLCREVASCQRVLQEEKQLVQQERRLKEKKEQENLLLTSQFHEDLICKQRIFENEKMSLQCEIKEKENVISSLHRQWDSEKQSFNSERNRLESTCNRLADENHQLRERLVELEILIDRQSKELSEHTLKLSEVLFHNKLLQTKVSDAENKLEAYRKKIFEEASTTVHSLTDNLDIQYALESMEQGVGQKLCNHFISLRTLVLRLCSEDIGQSINLRLIMKQLEEHLQNLILIANKSVVNHIPSSWLHAMENNQPLHGDDEISNSLLKSWESLFDCKINGKTRLRMLHKINELPKDQIILQVLTLLRERCQMRKITASLEYEINTLNKSSSSNNSVQRRYNNNSSQLHDSNLPSRESLYIRCLRIESRCRALIFQKRYLFCILSNTQRPESSTLLRSLSSSQSSHKRKRNLRMTFRIYVYAIVACLRMRFLVRKWEIKTHTLGYFSNISRITDVDSVSYTHCVAMSSTPVKFPQSFH